MEIIDIEYMTFHKDDPMIEITKNNFEKMMDKLNGPIPNSKGSVEIRTTFVDADITDSIIKKLNIVNTDTFTKVINFKLYSKGSDDELYSYSLMFSNITYYRNKKLFDIISIYPKLNLLKLKHQYINNDEVRFYFECIPYSLNFI